MSNPHSPSSEGLSLSVLNRLEGVCNHFERAWQAGQKPPIEDKLDGLPQPERAYLLRELLLLELAYLRRQGETPQQEEYLERFADDAELVRAVFHQEAARGAAPQPAAAESS